MQGLRADRDMHDEYMLWNSGQFFRYVCIYLCIKSAIRLESLGRNYSVRTFQSTSPWFFALINISLISQHAFILNVRLLCKINAHKLFVLLGDLPGSFLFMLANVIYLHDASSATSVISCAASVISCARDISLWGKNRSQHRYRTVSIFFDKSVALNTIALKIVTIWAHTYKLLKCKAKLQIWANAGIWIDFKQLILGWSSLAQIPAKLHLLLSAAHHP